MNDEWEGMHNNILRVHIILEFSDENDHEEIQRTLTESLLAAGKNRAMIILISYIRSHAADVSQVQAWQEMIPGILRTGAISRKRCNEENCSAIIDFNITGFPGSSGIQQKP